MLINCETCRMRDTEACDDCVVAVILEEGILDLDTDEQQAIEALAEAGLVPRLRLVIPERRAAG